MQIRKTLGAMMLSLALGVGFVAMAAPAQAAIDSRCSVTPLAPYKDGNGFRYGGTVNCSAAVATKVSTTGQRQGTLDWVPIATAAGTSAGSTSLTKNSTGSCLAGNSTYRSHTSGTSQNGGVSTHNSEGRSVAC